MFIRIIIEYFNLGASPIFRESYIVGKADITEKGIVKISDLQSIQQGIYFPNKKAAEIAVRTVKEYREKMRSKMEVVFNVFRNDDYEICRSFLE